MNFLGIALLLIFIMYLIDKHNRWQIAAKLTGGLIVLCILVVGGFFGWQKYQAYREEEQEQAEAAVRQARFVACVSRLEQIPLPKDAVAADVPNDIQSACGTNSDATTYLYVSTNQPLLPGATPIPSKPKLKTETQPQSQPNCQAVVCSGWAAVPSEYGSRIASRNCFGADLASRVSCGNIAVLKKGDRVQILSDKVRAPDGSDIYEAKFQQWTGWVSASDLSPEKEDGQ